MLRRLRRRESPSLSDSDLALNLSFVLHEHSASSAVRSAVRAVRGHQATIRRLDPSASTPATTSGDKPAAIDVWLSATIGAPHLLPKALGAPADHIVLIDAPAAHTSAVSLFRTTAALCLPEAGPMTIGVAALVLRPDRTTTHLQRFGAFDWPIHRDDALRALERVIQAHAGQWMPSRPLWAAPAETLLPDEVYLGSDDASRMS